MNARASPPRERFHAGRLSPEPGPAALHHSPDGGDAAGDVQRRFEEAVSGAIGIACQRKLGIVGQRDLHRKVHGIVPSTAIGIPRVDDELVGADILASDPVTIAIGRPRFTPLILGNPPGAVNGIQRRTAAQHGPRPGGPATWRQGAQHGIRARHVSGGRQHAAVIPVDIEPAGSSAPLFSTPPPSFRVTVHARMVTQAPGAT